MIPKNGVYIIQGELNHVVAALRRNNRWSGGHFHQDDVQDPLLNSFSQLKETLQDKTDVNDIDVNIFLGPFLEVIRSEDTTGPITGVALSSVNKFLSYGLIDPSTESAGSGIDNLADAVTHARFVGTDPSSDEVVLMKILQVLRTLLLSPVGVHMTNESVCEIMQSCFRICFEMRLSELLRRTAEQTLIDMVQLLFLRLPQFKEDLKNQLSAPHIRKMFKRSGPLASTRNRNKKSKRSQNKSHRHSKETVRQEKQVEPESTTAESQLTTNEPENTTTTTNTTTSVESSRIEITSPEVDNVTEVEEVKNLLDNIEKLTCDDIEFVKKTENNEQNIDSEQESNSERTLDEIDPEKMKSMSEGLDILGQDIALTERNSKSNALCVPDSLQSLESDQDIKIDEELKDENLENFKDHGVISLHYAEEDARSVDSMDVEETVTNSVKTENDVGSPNKHVEQDTQANSEYVNQQGVRFTPQEGHKEGHGPLVPYGLPCVRELLRFLTTLVNPHDRHNTNTMIHIGLSLLTVALESGASHIGHFVSLMQLIKDDLCKNIFALLQCDIHILFSISMRLSFLLFEALRGSLKFQQERFFEKLMDILMLENLTVPYEKREMALEYINQMFHIPCLVQELYVNFDCDLHSSNCLEDLCKTLSKNAFRPGNLSSVNLLALDALLTIVNQIEEHCHETRRTGTDTLAVKENKERSHSSSSERTAEYESGPDDMENDIIHTALSTSGYAVGKKLLGMGLGGMNKDKLDESKQNSVFHHQANTSAPTKEDIIMQKKNKKLLSHGIEEFNKKAKKGIEYLQEKGLLSTPLQPDELVQFFKKNQRVDKKTLGDYIGERKNIKVLEAFVRSFEMQNVRIDEALRSFLESFRLPGESPVISLILEEFSNKYYQINPTPYKNTDAAFTLAYAVIMLNVDQHNKNVKQQKSMDINDFKRNLRKTNGGEDFPPELLEEIFDNIRTNEIVMPAERTGKVKEAYEWKMLIQRSRTPASVYTHVNSATYDEELFLVVWGPTVAALSYVYDNGSDKMNIQKSIQGFRKCATISAHYNLSEVFDNLLISLCKFTSLLVTGQPSDNLPVIFGGNIKSQLSARTVFALAHKQGDILREGWQNLLVCMLQLLKGKMLPKVLTEVDDFVEQSGKISLIKEEPRPAPKQDNAGMFAAFFSFYGSSDPSSASVLTAEDKQAQDTALSCIKECHPENIITESKFLRPESLQELVKSLIIASKPEHAYESTDVPYDGEAAVFFLEFLIKVALQNRDRISLLWQSLQDHLSNIIISAPKYSFLVERAVVGLLRLCIRLIRRDDISAQVLITLRILLMMHPHVLLSCSKQISYGLHELIRTNASNIQYSRDWITILTILQVVGAGASPPIVKPGPCLTLISGDLYAPHEEKEKIDTETGETYQTGEHMDRGDSKDETEEDDDESKSPTGEQWLLINKNEDDDLPVNQYDLTFKEKLNKHDCKVFIKASSSIGFIVRDMAHVKDFNLFQCIYAVLLFGEACSNGGLKYRLEETVLNQIELEKHPILVKKSKAKRSTSPLASRKKGGVMESPRSEDEAEFNENTGNIYDAISLQLLDLMYALHTNASKILGNMTWEVFSEKQKAEVKARWSSKESIDQLPSTFRGDVDCEMSLLWVKCWCPLLQGIARLGCDIRREIRMSALTVLQRAMLAEDLQSLTATEWENCFNQVLFPMLASLLEVSAEVDPMGLEETRMRAATLLCKAFLQHLNTLISLSTFTALWMTILDFMDKYMHADNSDLLFEAIPESLKNMLLVMSTAGIFEHHHDNDPNTESQPQHLKADSKSRKYSALWQVTWERIDCFLPNLRDELLATQSPVSRRVTSPPDPDPPGGMTIHTEEEIARKTPSSSNTAVPKTEDIVTQSSSIEEVQTNVAPVVTPPTFNSPVTPVKSPSSPCLSSVRAESPLLFADEPSNLNIKLVAPLPHLSPPGSAHAIHDRQGSHPIPILLPPKPTLTSPEKTNVEKSEEETKCSSDVVKEIPEELSSPEKALASNIYDI
ncbi:Golgi-specific brefeldin A-resistance guanine nucleotide exchange factor 1-like [Hydractinia symbiolongicarpus]|uniref:Golgi-specific brefeldin A-resistance guanine nucleotide exchange factor 1-like n=1 Tax=Hydractinia symbiolongicarpus TaxID=13093 RepID=UPI00254B6CB0|nr:Golgi-specific brefeldin A-resistance guanine nucleotide exchange factor 1-like [Hydractinia symbiolongicarpus]